MLAAGYLVVARREASAARLVSFVAGCALLAVALASPLDTIARDYLVWGHLLQNVVLARYVACSSGRSVCGCSSAAS